MGKTKTSLKDRLAEKRKNLSGGGDGNMIFVKAGVTRFRPVPVGENNDWSFEVLQFYLGNEIKGVISPKSIGKPCGIMEAYERLKASKKESNRKLALKMKPKKKYIVLGYAFKDEKGKEPDIERGVRPALLAKGSLQDMIDLYLDDENGDFTDAINGYDIKLRRTGTTMTDTEYSATACQSTKCLKKFRGPYDLQEAVTAIIPTYKETLVIAERFLNLPPEEDEESTPKKKKKRKTDM